MMKVLISSYHLTATSTKYPPMIWNLLYSNHLFVLVILLYHSNYSLGFSAFISLNFISFTWFDFLFIWFNLRFASIKAFTWVTTLGFNFLIFSLGGGLNPFLNLNNSSELLLLFLRGRLLLPPLKVSNPLNGLYPMMLKYEKCSLPILPLLTVLFCWLLSF